MTCHSDLQYYHSWPLDACIGVGHQEANRGHRDVRGIGQIHMKNADGLLQSTLENSRWSIADNRPWAQVNGTQVSTTLGHQMPPPGGIEGAYRVDGVGVHLTKHQPDPQADDMSFWPAVVLLLTTRCLYWGGGIRGLTGGIGGYIWKIKMVYCKVLLKTQDGLLKTIEHELRSMGPKLVPLLATRYLCLGAIEGLMGVGVHLTKHQPDPQADDMSCWPAVVSLLTTRCLYWGGSGGVRGWQGV